MHYCDVVVSLLQRTVEFQSQGRYWITLRDAMHILTPLHF
jgi:hypothetical protein